MRELPNYIWDPDTNRYVKDDGSADSRGLREKERIAKEKQKSLLESIPLVKLKLEDVELTAHGIFSVIPDETACQL
jgi:hypothetical protein